MTLSVIAIVGALACSGISIAYVLTRQRRKAKKPTRLITAMGCLYFATLYIVGLVNPNIYLIRAGILTRLGVILLFALLISEVIADWRKEDH